MVLNMICTSFSPTFHLFGKWNMGPRIMVDYYVKFFICLVARRNSMKLMVECDILLQVQVCVGVNLNMAHA